ncbi:MAG: bifunctional phosphoribosylaminoimidazolecarboxamide formyltransferase/IMP cyclohydrolase [Acidimicrobiia bacterium]|nr:MAG: bifunctional phosphoribosylaminoimidazolecarboxamide formyltransferase/IMP cyclohydrolase [Acidimicrobiia bacterium]
MARVPIAVLISGRGSNLRRLLEMQSQSAYDIVLVLADRDAAGLEWAETHDIPTRIVRWRDHPDRAAFTAAICGEVEAFGCEFVVLAGFMRILAPVAIERFPERIINIHPSLLPAFPGAHAVEDALAAGVSETGVTVHVVVEDVDAGPILAQRSVPIHPDDDADRLHARIQEQEHSLYPAVIDDLARQTLDERVSDTEGESMSDRIPIKRALLSVSDKTGLADLGAALAAAGVEIIASGGTSRALQEAGVDVVAVPDVTGAPEMLGGRVKTLHPKIHGAILADTSQAGHVVDLNDQGIVAIDLVVCNLYPFEATVAAGKPADEVVENIDIGGPAMIRAAAKNHARVAVVTSPESYPVVLGALADGGTTMYERRRLATEAFAHTGRYDSLIHGWLSQDELLPETRLMALERVGGLRYGENPHQEAALYRQAGADGWAFGLTQLQGKELSFNNYADTESAWDLVQRLSTPGCVVVKHMNPCGVATRGTLHAAFVAARDCDPLSAFGGVVAVNERLDEATAKEMSEMFLEVIICPEVTDEAAAVLGAKKNLRVLVAPPPAGARVELRQIDGGALIQETDPRVTVEDDWTVVSEAQPGGAMLDELRLAWTVTAHCKSNSIVIVKEGAAVGIGVGDQSRVGAAERAVRQAGDRTIGAVAASEALIPFRDGPDALAEAGVVALVETGGSRNDQEVIDAANEHGMVLVFTGMRHFRH